MASPFGWYGPLIDLREASSHIADFVQLLVFVHRSFPVHYKSSKSGDLIRTDIQVGDDTMPYFGVALWQNQMASKIAAGDLVLLQNMKIVKYGDVVEARTVQWSSLLCLVHPYESLISKGVEELMTGCRVGATAKDKLRSVVMWVQQYRSTICNIKLWSDQVLASPSKQLYLFKNWEVLQEKLPQNCSSLMEVSQLKTCCKVRVCASTAEIIPLVTPRSLGNTKKDNIFISERLCKTKDKSLVDDLLCIGCRLCGLPLNSEFEKNATSLICSKSSSCLHTVALIYRPFMLYVWDESDYMPVLVRNKAAEILFGNIKAEKVYLSYREQMLKNVAGPQNKFKDAAARLAGNMRISGEGHSTTNVSDASERLPLEEKHLPVKIFNIYDVWLIILKLLLRQGNNSPLKFEILVDPRLNVDNGRFEMIFASMPCFGPK
ncbi:hypothetical protein HN51_028117 [Arachis hypogaea]|uniref:Uncharacterized protein n=2 Tax=Arachis TaxID=3817 RepID=A0A445BK67_ARAHY|nr:uncharacterized protein LOC107465480 [Arachis duranensis]XP_025619117.1 uncharacterized protein LOC112710885 [Arachis hypogaea]QHO34573.1 uncharacterized protein DS421_9g268110 [Arachis hypogaea]RYR39076.1 hypothetical protein Ahy_A09g044500 [Arachis hypogaea]